MRLLSSFLFLLPLFLAAQGLEQRVDEYLQPLVEAGDFYGTVLFAKNGEVVLTKGYGFAGIEHQVKNRPNTIHHIASVNKPITAIGVLLLHQKGKLHIDDPVANYLPEYPNGKQITIKQLLSHTSGIPSYNDFPDYTIYAKRENELGEVVNWFKDKELQFTPGTKYDYSNSNFVLAAYLIEKVSGNSYDVFMRKNIFEPLGMLHTARYAYDEIIPDRAEGYDPANNKYGLKKTGFYNNSIKVGSGALYATVQDLLKLDQALYGEKLLTLETKTLMFTPIGENEYGLGWGIWPRFGLKKYDHDGASPGSVAYFSRYPDERVTIIFLGNINTGAFRSMKYDLAAIYFGKEYKVPEPRKYFSLSAEELSPYQGRYEFANGNFFDLKVIDNSLRFLWRGRGELGYLLSPLNDGKFYMRARGDQIHFVEEDGKPKVLYLERSGTSELKRIKP